MKNFFFSSLACSLNDVCGTYVNDIKFVKFSSLFRETRELCARFCANQLSVRADEGAEIEISSEQNFLCIVKI